MEKFLQSLVRLRHVPVEVKAGDRFCRRRRDNVKETALVTDLRPDPFGIPHVHFRLTFEQTTLGRVEGGKRLLALDSFVETYNQRIV